MNLQELPWKKFLLSKFLNYLSYNFLSPILIIYLALILHILVSLFGFSFENLLWLIINHLPTVYQTANIDVVQTFKIFLYYLIIVIFIFELGLYLFNKYTIELKFNIVKFYYISIISLITLSMMTLIIKKQINGFESIFLFVIVFITLFVISTICFYIFYGVRKILGFLEAIDIK